MPFANEAHRKCTPTRSILQSYRRTLRNTALDIVKEVFSDYEGLRSVRIEGPEKAPPTYEFVIQYRESDLNFVMRVLERDGLYFYFEHEATLHTMVITDSARIEVPGFDVIRFHPPDMNAEQIRPTRAASRRGSYSRWMATPSWI